MTKNALNLEITKAGTPHTYTFQNSDGTLAHLTDIPTTTAPLTDSTNKRFVSDAQLTVIGNTSNTNTGDETTATIKTKLGITTLSGSNTGDQTTTAGLSNSTNKNLLTDAQLTVVGNTSGTNTGDNSVNTRYSGISGIYRNILQGNGSHIAGRVAGTYFLPLGNPLGITGTGTLYAPSIIRIDSADYPTIDSLAPKFRIKWSLMVNDVAPTGNFTIGLYPITRPATSGGAGLDIYTMGTVVSGSNGSSFTTPIADSMNTGVSSDFALPADGYYVLGIVTTATVAVSSHLHINAKLEVHNA